MISIIIPVYKDAKSALRLASALETQVLPAGEALEIIAVDDGSGDGTAEALERSASSNVRVVALPQNAGRAMACNTGAERSRGDKLVFIDCDCRPSNNDFLASHWRMLESGYVGSCGKVIGDGNGFWSRYQADASARREQQHAHGVPYANSTQNFAVDKATFVRLGGFDTRYRKYGFEDRDLLLRLSHSGDIGWCREAEVHHLDLLTLPSVLDKMMRASGESAVLFMHDHAQAYRELGYAAIDTRLHGWLRPVCAALGPVLRIAPTIDSQLKRDRVPYVLAKPIVKLLVALAYARGSMASRASGAPG